MFPECAPHVLLQGPGQQELAEKLFNKLQKIMRASKVDWTVFWRQLGVVSAIPSTQYHQMFPECGLNVP
jgi:uncharacterized protein YdiU (UPF0061 family)